MTDIPHDSNSYADANRLRKVLRFLGLFKMSRLSIGQIKRMNDAEWRLAAMCIGYDDASEITRNLIVQVMTDWAAMRTLAVPVAQARSVLGEIKHRTRDKPGPKPKQ